MDADETYLMLIYGNIEVTVTFLNGLPEDFLLKYGYTKDNGLYWDRGYLEMYWATKNQGRLESLRKKLIKELVEYHSGKD